MGLSLNYLNAVSLGPLSALEPCYHSTSLHCLSTSLFHHSLQNDSVIAPAMLSSPVLPNPHPGSKTTRRPFSSAALPLRPFYTLQMPRLLALDPPRITSHQSPVTRHRLPRSSRGDEIPVTLTALKSALSPRAKPRGTNRDAHKSFRFRSCKNCWVSSSRSAYQWSYLHTGILPPVNSFVCHSYENCRGVGYSSHSGTEYPTKMRVLPFSAQSKGRLSTFSDWPRPTLCATLCAPVAPLPQISSLHGGL